MGFNVDTLYSSQFDVSEKPLILSVPQRGERFWIFQIVDAGNDVPTAPGARGGSAQAAVR